jgi:hypothetical protein
MLVALVLMMRLISYWIWLVRCGELRDNRIYKLILFPPIYSSQLGALGIRLKYTIMAMYESLTKSSAKLADGCVSGALELHICLRR